MKINYFESNSFFFQESNSFFFFGHQTNRLILTMWTKLAENQIAFQLIRRHRKKLGRGRAKNDDHGRKEDGFIEVKHL